jgi:hypothetical protein
LNNLYKTALLPPQYPRFELISSCISTRPAAHARETIIYPAMAPDATQDVWPLPANASSVAESSSTDSASLKLVS